MYSTFIISKSECTSCTNKTLKSLGTLQDVFGAEIDQIEGKVLVSHVTKSAGKKLQKCISHSDILNLKTKKKLITTNHLSGDVLYKTKDIRTKNQEP